MFRTIANDFKRKRRELSPQLGDCPKQKVLLLGSNHFPNVKQFTRRFFSSYAGGEQMRIHTVIDDGGSATAPRALQNLLAQMFVVANHSAGFRVHSLGDAATPSSGPPNSSMHRSFLASINAHHIGNVQFLAHKHRRVTAGEGSVGMEKIDPVLGMQFSDFPNDARKQKSSRS